MIPSGGLLSPPQIDTLRTSLARNEGSHPAFGERLAIPNNTTADVWAGVATKRPLPLAPKPMFVVSSSAGDTFGVSGAQLVLVTFIDELGDWRNSDLLVMNGLSNVAVTYKPTDGILGRANRPPTPPTPPSGSSVPASVFRVQDASVVTSLGATEDAPSTNNLGNVDVRDGGGKVFDRIPIGAGRSRSASFHCPRGHAAKLTYAPFGSALGRGTAFIGTNFGLGTAWSILPVSSVENTTALFDSDAAVTRIVERTDVQGIVKVGSNNIDVQFMMQFRLERML